MRSVVKLIASLASSFLAAAIGGLATGPNIPTWYASLDKPIINPPNYVFGPVWTVLYTMIGISLYLVWVSRSGESKKSAFVVYLVQIILNALWSIVFFGLHLPWLGVVVIASLIVTTIANIFVFHRHSKTAAYLLVPYLLWICFATILTVGIAILN